MAAVGKILPCPRCGSMVKIDPPGVSTESGSPGSAPAVVQADASFDQIDDVLGQTTNAAENVVNDAEHVGAGAANVSPPEAPPLPLDGWESGAVTRWRMLVLIGTASTVGVLVVTGLIRLLFVSDSAPQLASPVRVTQPLAPEIEETVVETPDALPSAEVVKSTDAAHRDESSSERIHTNETETPANEEPLASSSIGLNPELRAHDVETTDREQLAEIGPAEAAVIAADGPPVDTPPTANNTPGENAPVNEGEQQAAADVNDHQDPFQNLTTTYKPLLPARDIDVSARLEDTIQGIHFEEATLIDFLRFVSQLSTVPIALDPHSARMSNALPTSPVSVSSSRVSLRGLLSEVLEQKKLDFQTGDNYVVVKSRYSMEGLPRDVRHQVGDLTGDDLRAASRIAKYIVQLISPESWDSVGGLGRISISDSVLGVHQTIDVHFAINDLLERLRLARGLAPRRASRSPSLTPLWRTARTRLKTPVSLRHFGAIQFAELLQRIEDESDTVLLADWEPLTRLGIYPDHEIESFSADGVPLEQVLRDWLLPQGLTFQPVTGRIFQITTDEAADRTFTVEFYRPQDVANSLVEPKEMRAVADEKSGYTIVAAPASVHELLTVGERNVSLESRL